MTAFKIDENIPKSIKKTLKQKNIICFDVFEEYLNGKSDVTILKTIIDEKLILITLDYDFSDIRQYKKEFSGVIILNPIYQSIDNINNLIIKLCDNLDKFEFKNSIYIFSEENIRVRKINLD